MRSLRKRVVVINDGFAKSKISARQRINIVVNRYLEKMSKKGWIPTRVSTGDNFAEFEAYISMAKPDDEKEKEYLIKDGVDGFNVDDAGIWKW